MATSTVVTTGSGAELYNIGSADETYSLEDFVNMGSSDDVTYYNYSIVEYLNGFEMFITNILYDYEDELSDLAVSVKLTERERLKYRYKPWLFTYDVYGSTEAEFVIMTLNGIIDPKEFDFTTIKAIKKDDLSTLLGRIASSNETYLNNNRATLQTDLKNNTGDDIWVE